MANEVAGIDIVARLDQFRAEMAKIPDIGGKEAKALAAQLSKEIKSAEKAARDAAKASKDTKTGFDALGSAAGKLGTTTAKAAGGLSLVDERAGAAARAVNDLADLSEVAAGAGEALGVSAAGATVAIGALAQVVGVAYVAWRIYAEDGERAAKITGELMAAQTALTPILQSTRQATIDLQEATGALSEEQADLERNAIRAHEALLKATETTRTRMAELRKEQQSITTAMVDFAESVVPAWTPAGMALDAFTTDSDELGEELGALQGALDEANEATRENVAVTNEAIKGKERHKVAVDRLKESIDAANESIAAEAALAEENESAFTSALASMEAVRSEAVAAQFSDLDRVKDAYTDQLAALRDTYKDAAKLTEENTSAREEVDRAYEDARVAIVTSAEEAIRAEGRKTAEASALALQKAEDDLEAYAERQKELAAAARDSSIQAAADVFDASSAFIDSLSFKNKDAALLAFRINKGVQIASATANTALAVVNALATVPYPATPFVAAAAGVAGAAQIAAIVATQPSFEDTPGVMKVGSRGGTSVHLADDDFFAAAKSPTALQSQVGGGAVSFRVGRKEVREIHRTDKVTNGGFTRAIKTATGKRAGVSGRRPLA